jgi:hypothetical protein
MSQTDCVLGLLALAMHLASFPLEKLGFRWMLHVDWNVMPEYVTNRLRVGVAGYQFANAIMTFGPPDQGRRDFTPSL